MDNMNNTPVEDGQEEKNLKKSPFEKKLVIPTKSQINFATVWITPMNDI